MIEWFANLSARRKGIMMIAIAAAILVLIMSGQLIEVNRAGYYQVKQAFLSGKMTARMTPGFYGQLLGDIDTYRAVATVGFGNEKGEGSTDIPPIDVIFNDGSKATQSGLVRIRLPQTQEQMISLKKKYASGFDHFIRAGVVPAVKNAVRLAANLRSAQDAYTTVAVYQEAISDQLANGLYKTQSVTRYDTAATGQVSEVKVTEIVRTKDGQPVRVMGSNALIELGCEVQECMISSPDFDKIVTEMIAKRKEESMKTELAKQAALRAKQDKLTIIEEGKAKVAKVQYEKEQEKIAAVTDAEKDKEVAELEAKKKLEVAKLDRKAASEYKVKRILEAEADATYKRKVMVADGALQQKLDAWKFAQEKWADAFKNTNANLVPQMIMGGSDGKSSATQNAALMWMQTMGMKAARDLSLDMGTTTRQRSSNDTILDSRR